MQNNLNLFNRCYDEYWVINDSRPKDEGIKKEEPSEKRSEKKDVESPTR